VSCAVFWFTISEHDIHLFIPICIIVLKGGKNRVLLSEVYLLKKLLAKIQTVKLDAPFLL